MKRMSRPSLPIVLMAYLLLGLLYSVIVPVFEAPDERQHYGYVQYLASERRLPPRGETSLAGHEATQPPLYYAVAALSTAWRSHDSSVILDPNRYYANYQAPGTVNDNKNTLLHSDVEDFPWEGAVLTVHVTRLVNLLFGGLTVAATYLLAREIFSERFLALCAAATVAFTPQFLFISSAINNDIAAGALSTVTLWLIVGGVRRNFSSSRVALLGVAIGLAALSKVSALALLPLTLFVVALESWRPASGSQPGHRLRQILTRWVVVVGVASIVGGWWYVRNGLLYRDPFGLQTHLDAWWRYQEPLSMSSLLSQLPGVALSFWAAFGMGNIHLPKAAYVFAMSLAAVATAGLATWVFRAWRSGKRPGPQTRSLAVLALWSLVVFVALLRWMQLVKAALGRLLFPAVGALSILIVWGLRQFMRYALKLAPSVSPVQPRVERMVSAFLVVALFFVAVAAPFVAIRPAYARPDLLSRQEIADRVHSAEIQFGDAIRFVGYDIGRRSAHPGDEIPVTLCWECTAGMEKDYAYFVHFLGPRDSIVGARDTYPGLGRFPTSQWRPTDAFCEVVRVPIDDAAPSQVVYDVEIGWYEPETDRRLPAYGSQGNAIDLVTLGQIRVAPEIPPSVTVPQRVDANLGGQITLLGYRLSRSLVQSSQPLTATLYWEAQTAIQEDYTVFLHLSSAGAPPQVQDDSQPRSGSYPTSAWEPGEVVTDQHVLRIPEDLPAGNYQLLAGMYLLETGERLIWRAPDGTARSDSVPLETVVVQPGAP